MKRFALLAGGFLFLCLIIVGCSGSDSDSGSEPGENNPPIDTSPQMKMGLLQFKVEHTIQDDTCLPDQCDFTFQDQSDTAGWLDRLAADSNMAVLHWDRAIPWLEFDKNPPAGVSRVDFFDGRIDTNLRNWIDAFVDHFDRMPSGYLAVSVLNGERNGLERYHMDGRDPVEVAGECPVLSPGTQISFQYDSGGGPVTASFDLERSYTNFVMYLYDKLQPDYLALMVEVNLFKSMRDPCPANWDGLVQLYRQIYDTVRPQVDSQTKVFATLTYQQLLGFEDKNCHGDLNYEACTGDPSPPAYPAPVLETCYPLELSAIEDLDQGGRLEILALSLYPDALLMGMGDDNLMKLYPKDWDGTSECLLRAQTGPFLDPVPSLDRLNWTKPIAIAELGARSDRTIQFKGDFLVRMPGDLTSQSFWLDHFLMAAQDRGFEFYVQAFSNDYVPIGPWTVSAGILDEFTYSLLNNFAYMGLYDEHGAPKAGVTDTWGDALK